MAQAEDALKDDDYAAVLVAAASFEDDDNALVGHYKRKIAARSCAPPDGISERELRPRGYEREEVAPLPPHDRTRARSSARRTPQLRSSEARKREQARLARIARDNRTCTSSEKSTVRYGGGTPAGCSDYAIDLANRRAERAAEEAAAAAPPVDDYGDSSDDSSSSGGTGNWCGATRDGDGDGIWCEGR